MNVLTHGNVDERRTELLFGLLLSILKGDHSSPPRERGSAARQLDELSRTELRVLRYLPTNLRDPRSHESSMSP